MPLDFWIARTHSFESILSPSPAGPIPHDEVVRVLDGLPLQPNATSDRWVLDAAGRPLATLETVAVGDSDVVRLGVSMATADFADRCRTAWTLAADLAQRFDANAFEATAGRAIAGVVSDRYVASRQREATRVTERLAPNGLAPLEFPVENLDAVANVLTLVSERELPLPGKRWVHGESERGKTARWRWEKPTFAAAFDDLQAWLSGGVVDVQTTLDARQLDQELIDALTSRSDPFYADFYLYWRDSREDFANA